MAVREVVPAIKRTLDLSPMLPKAWPEAPLPGVIAFAALIVLLSMVGLGPKPQTETKRSPSEIDGDLAKNGEISADEWPSE
jgi:hypothetical protein